ncbi:MAG TPA: SIS domain-containing protein [Candidatus Paceibacterota bacterium]|nr:SIS domain-containing protein [Candidatus Paceibacterota bacterium]
MTYEDMILGLPRQFSYRPEIIHADKLPADFDRVIIAGMGGSRLAPDFLNIHRPDLELHIHSDYDLPHFTPDHLRHSFVIAHSYSGNTAETVSATNMALQHNLPLAVIASGGELIRLAQEHDLPHVILPVNDLVPRLAVGYEIMALAGILKLDLTSIILCGRISGQAPAFLPDAVRHLEGSIPLVYAPNRFNELGYGWKIILNETAKMPAFCNRFPELDHNELEALIDAANPQQFRCIILEDQENPRIMNRIAQTIKLLETRGVKSYSIPLEGETPIEKVIHSLISAHWIALALANKRSIDPIRVPAIESFKHELCENS